MRESCLVYCYSGIQSLFEVVLLYTFYTRPSIEQRPLFDLVAMCEKEIGESETNNFK